MPEKYRKPPRGYPDLRLLQEVEDPNCGIPNRAITSHLNMLKDAGTLYRTYHCVQRVALMLCVHGVADFHDDKIMEVLTDRLIDDPEHDGDGYHEYWSSATH